MLSWNLLNFFFYFGGQLFYDFGYFEWILTRKHFNWRLYVANSTQLKVVTPKKNQNSDSMVYVIIQYFFFFWQMIAGLSLVD